MGWEAQFYLGGSRILRAQAGGSDGWGSSTHATRGAAFGGLATSRQLKSQETMSNLKAAGLSVLASTVVGSADDVRRLAQKYPVSSQLDRSARDA